MAAVGALVGGIGVVAGATAAWATPTLSASPSTGLTAGQTITLSGSGFTSTTPGNILECNNAPNEPTVALGSPVNNSLAVGCTGVGYISNALTSANSSGVVSKSFQLAPSATVGPPCGQSGDIIMTCPATDSAGKSPAADAANFPCPPTAAQQAAGVTCQITFGNQANESASVNILFQGESAPTTTAAPVASTTPPTTAAPTATTAPSTSALATTGPGSALWVLALSGLALVMAAAVLWLTTRRAWAGTRAPPASSA